MLDTVATLRREALNEIDAVPSLETLEALRVSLLGRKGRITEILKSLGSVEPEQRRLVGSAVNELKEEATAAIEARKSVLMDSSSVLSSPLDSTVPGIPPLNGDDVRP